MKKTRIAVLLGTLFSFSVGAYSQLWKQYADSALHFKQNNQIEKALAYYIKSNKLLNKDSAGTATYALSCNLLGKSYSDLGQWNEAEAYCLKALNIWGNIESKPGYYGKDGYYYIVGCTDLANIYWNMGQYEKAEPLFLHAKKVLEKYSKEDKDYAAVCINLGLLYKDMSQYKKAEPLYIEARQLFKRISGVESLAYATACNNLADLYTDLGEYEKAEALFIEAKKIREKGLGKENLLYRQSCNNLADLYMHMGQYEEAELLFIEARQIIEKLAGKEHPDFAQNCNNLGILYEKMDQYEKAEPLFIEAKKINEHAVGKEHPDYATNCNNLAILYGQMREYQKAESLYLEIKQIKEKTVGKNHISYALNCDNLGALYVEMGEYKKAGLLLLEANRLYENVAGNEHRYFSVNCKNLVVLYWRMNKPVLAEAFLQKALSAETKQLKKIFQFTGEKEKQLFIQNIFDSYDTDQSFYFDQVSFYKAGASYNLSVRNRNLILSSAVNQRQIIYASNDTGLQKLYEQWVSVREQLASDYLKPIAERNPAVAKREEEASNLEKKLSRSSAEFSRQSAIKNIGWKNIQQKLRQDEAAIEFVEFGFSNSRRYTDSIYYIALVLRKDKPEPELIRLFEKKQLDSLLNSTEAITIENRIKALYTGNQSLYDLVWKPLEKYLNGISKVYFAAAGNLFKISFAALPVDNRYVLSDKYQLIQLNTTATVIENDRSFLTAPGKIQLYGGIVYETDTITSRPTESSYQPNLLASRSLPDGLIRGSGFRYLPGTRKETVEIRKQASEALMPVEMLLGADATEESIKALNGKVSPLVLHIATHGFFFPDPKEDEWDELTKSFERSGKAFKQSNDPLLRSGLVFAGANNAWRGKPVEGIEDGILTAFEVSNMYLPNTKLVVLSACETALGDIQGSEGVYGLQRSFKMAGVQNLVMSLWKVPDAETAEFMQLFYKNLFAKQTINNAFYNAQQVMKNRYRAAPYKWAAWVLVK